MVTIELFGQPHTFKADTEVARAQEVAELLKHEVDKAAHRRDGPSTHIPKMTILILAALNMAHTIIQSNEETGAFLGQMAKRCETLNRMLDEGLLQLKALQPDG